MHSREVSEVLLHQTSVSEKIRCWGAGLWSEGDTISSVIMGKPVSPFSVPEFQGMAFQGMAWKFFYLTRGFSYFLHGQSLCISIRHVVYGILYMENPNIFLLDM